MSSSAKRHTGKGAEAAVADISMGLIGCTGRMGRMLIAEIAGAEGCVLAGGSASADSRFIGQDLGDLAAVPRLGLAVGDDTGKLIDGSDVAIEFTSAEATAEEGSLAAGHGKPILIGATRVNGCDAPA